MENDDSSLRQEILNVLETECALFVEPDGMTDDRRSEAVATVAGRHPNLAILNDPSTSQYPPDTTRRLYSLDDVPEGDSF